MPSFDVISIPGMLRISLYESISTAPLISLWSVMATPMLSFPACLAISAISCFHQNNGCENEDLPQCIA